MRVDGAALIVLVSMELLHVTLTLTVLLRSLRTCCPVAFSKICPAGKGYFIHNSRETLSVSPSLSFIIPEGNKEGESLNASLTIILFQPTFISFSLQRFFCVGVEMLDS